MKANLFYFIIYCLGYSIKIGLPLKDHSSQRYGHLKKRSYLLANLIQEKTWHYLVINSAGDVQGAHDGPADRNERLKDESDKEAAVDGVVAVRKPGIAPKLVLDAMFVVLDVLNATGPILADAAIDGLHHLL